MIQHQTGHNSERVCIKDNLFPWEGAQGVEDERRWPVTNPSNEDSTWGDLFLFSTAPQAVGGG